MDKNVLVVNQFAIPRTESGGTRHVDLFECLSGWNFSIIAGNRNYTTQARIRDADEKFILKRVVRSDGGGLRRTLGWIEFSARSVIEIFKQRNVDVIYASSPQLFSAFSALLAAKVRRIPFVFEVRDLWPDTFATAGALSTKSVVYKVLKGLERSLARYSEHVVVVAEGWEEHFANLGTRADRFSVIPNGADVGRFPDKENAPTIREKYGLSGITAVYAGAHGFANGLDLVLDCAARTPRVTFLLIGDGPKKRHLQARVAEEGISNVYFREPMSKDALCELLVGCDIGIHCLKAYDALDQGMSPNKLFDYMAAGLPSISNAGASARRLLGDAQFGIAVNESGLSDGLDQVLQMSESDRLEMGDRAKEIIKERFSREAAGTRLRGILEALSR